MQSIMLATDGSPSAEDATRGVMDLAHELELPATDGRLGRALPGLGVHLRVRVRRGRAGAPERRGGAACGRVLAAVRERGEAAGGVATETVPLFGLPRLTRSAGPLRTRTRR